MYPEMIEVARAEGAKDAEKSLRYASEVEKYHAQLYHNMLEDFDKIKEGYPYYICPVCGMTVEKQAPKSCPVCGVKGSMFRIIE
jgi:rubrerythrin